MAHLLFELNSYVCMLIIRRVGPVKGTKDKPIVTHVS